MNAEKYQEAFDEAVHMVERPISHGLEVSAEDHNKLRSVLVPLLIGGLIGWKIRSNAKVEPVSRSEYDFAMVEALQLTQEAAPLTGVSAEEHARVSGIIKKIIGWRLLTK